MVSKPTRGTHSKAAIFAALLAASISGLVGVVAIEGIRPALAASEMDATLRSYESKIKSLDPSVRDVKVHLGSQATSSACIQRIPENRFIAFYCPLDRGVFLNDFTIKYLHSKYGNPGLFYVMAHELAHGRQHAVTGFSRQLVVIATPDELQADCIAGSYLTLDDRAKPNKKTYSAMRAMAKDLGDYHVESVDWHGTPDMREKALQWGVQARSPEGCLSMELFNFGSLPGFP